MKRDVEKAVEALNAKAERLGWERRFSLRAGSHTNGVQHVLEENVSWLAHPLSTTKIGATYGAAAKYLEAFGDAMTAALGERERERIDIMSGEASRPAHRVYDPDARGFRRAGEAVI